MFQNYYFFYIVFRNGFILSDDADKTSADNIFAIGDVLDGKPELTPVAIQAGKLLARRLFAGAKDKVAKDFHQLSSLPFVVYCN